MNNNTSEKAPKLTWVNIINAIVQAAIAALTALGITSCTKLL